MGRDSSGGFGELIFVLILLALGGTLIRKMRRDYDSRLDLLDSHSAESEKISEPIIPKVKVFPLNRQITYRKKENKIIVVRKVVRPNPLPYHLEKGWQKIGRVYHGYYRCKLGAFKGEIGERPGGDYKFYIFNPPEAVLNGPHAPCFTPVGNNRYHIHFRIDARSLDAGVMSVERLLYQSINRR